MPSLSPVEFLLSNYLIWDIIPIFWYKSKRGFPFVLSTFCGGFQKYPKPSLWHFCYPRKVSEGTQWAERCFPVCPCLFRFFLLQVDRSYKLIYNLYCSCAFTPPISFARGRYSFYLFSDVYPVYKRIEYFRRQFRNFRVPLYQPYKFA